MYVHCTAGLGRAPAISIAYMYWILGMNLLDAHKTLTSLRPCNPKLDAIRHATCDMLFGSESRSVKVSQSTTKREKRVPKKIQKRN